MEKNTTKTLLTDEEIKREKRKKQLAIIKASNEMLEQAKETVLNTDKIDEVSRSERVKEIDQAIYENNLKAKTYLNATQKEVEESVYKEVSEEEKRKYEERLKKRGITEESLNRMDIATVSTNKEEVKSKRKHTVKRKKVEVKEEDKQEEIVRLPDEEELMKKTMATPMKIDEKLRKDTKQEDKFEKELIKEIDSKKVKKEKEDKKVVVENDSDIVRENEDYVVYDFDFSQIPDYVQYDMIPLPSKGRCYPIDSPLRSGRVPVAYLTAADENIIASPNMYRDGKIIDVILERKILDKRVKPDVLCSGDRDAIVLWLRATGYTPDFPIVATHPETGKNYDINVDLNSLKTLNFELNGDENGLFTFTTTNGDVLKFNFLTFGEEDNIKKHLMSQVLNNEVVEINKSLNNISNSLAILGKKLTKEDIDDIKGCIGDAKDILYEAIKDEINDENIMINYITGYMYQSIKSVNGNTDKTFIKEYVNNMRSFDSYKYRNFYEANKPGIDMNITVNIPESDGGGSFITFLKFSNYVFTNI